jgi:hypothetical protein
MGSRSRHIIIDSPCLSYTSSIRILLSNNNVEDVYERQGESIIMWRDRDPIKGESEYALSFQHAGKF